MSRPADDHPWREYRKEPKKIGPEPTERLYELRCDDCGKHMGTILIDFVEGQEGAIESAKSTKVLCDYCGPDPLPEGHEESK